MISMVRKVKTVSLIVAIGVAVVLQGSRVEAGQTVICGLFFGVPS
jgi:hypothetical protein